MFVSGAHAYFLLCNHQRIIDLSDKQLDHLIFIAQNERIERAIERGEYKPEEE